MPTGLFNSLKIFSFATSLLLKFGPKRQLIPTILIIENMKNILYFLAVYYFTVNAQTQDDTCDIGNGVSGVCMVISKCSTAVENLQLNKRPKLCGFSGLRPIVCCPTTRIVSATTALSGEKSNQKCLEYSPPPLAPGKAPLMGAVGGVKSLAKEFPHMAALGYQHEDHIGWYCGGSLISERYVVTAAHCLHHREAGPVTFVRLGDLDIRNDTDDAQPQDFTVSEAIPHPDYKPPRAYNDIALIRLDRDVIFTDYVRPICLETEYEISDALPPTATGWGRTEFGGDTSDILMKVTLDFFTNKECKEAFAMSSKRRLPDGVDDRVLICAGGRDVRMDTCQGDSGGPLQTYNYTRRSYKLVGITSFGMACGIPGIPAIYTRVSSFVDWIEGIVWPN